MFSNYLIIITSKKAQLILGFFLAFCSLNISSSDHYDFNIYADKEILEEVASSKKWLRILNYSNNKLEVKDQKFYLSQIDSFSPEEELVATIEEYLSHNKNYSEFICNNPARAIFLDHSFKSLPNFDHKRCKDFYEWSQQGNINSISLLHVTGYLENPASFFGHTLIKFNSNDLNTDNNLLNQTLNYGAHTNNDAALPYVIRGLSGIYDASLTEEKFYRLSAQYQEFQMRDIYEYELKFSEYQRNLIIAYSYELIQKRFKYYFLSDNCAYRMNLIIGLALEKDPLPNRPWAAPIDLIIGIQETGLVNIIKYHPSQTTKTVKYIENLNSTELKQFLKFTSNLDEGIIIGNESSSLHLTSLEYLNYMKLKGLKNNEIDKVEELDEKRKKILLNFEENNEIKRVKIKNDSYPHEINLPTLIRYSPKKITNKEIVHSFQLRGSNFDLLDQDRTKLGNSIFTMLSPKVSIFEGKLLLDEFILFKVLSMNNLKTPIPNNSNYAWGVEVSRKNLSDECFPCAVNLMQGTIGKALYVSENLSTYVLGNLSFHSSRLNSGNLSSSFNTGIILSSRIVNLQVDYRDIRYDSSNHFDDKEIKLIIKFNISKEKDLAIIYKTSEIYDSFQFDFNKYF